MSKPRYQSPKWQERPCDAIYGTGEGKALNNLWQKGANVVKVHGSECYEEKNGYRPEEITTKCEPPQTPYRNTSRLSLEAYIELITQ